MELIFTANSPGEVSTWLAPTLRAVKERAPGAVTTVFLVPCAFATGAEADVVRAMPEADRAFGPGDYWRVALGLRRFAWAGGRRPSRAALLYLGGDLVHAAALARRLRVPALAYLERGSRWSRRFAEVLVPDERARRSVLRRGEADQRIAVVGDLMVDAVRGGAGRRRLAAEWGLDPEKPIVALFPGSRPYEIRLTIRFFLRAMELLRADHPDAQCVISLSAYGTPDLLRGSDEDALEGTSVTVEAAGGRWRVTTQRGLTAVAVQGRPYDVMGAADMALTVPGSNTAEMAAAGLPMVVVLPMNLVEKIPLPGAAQYAERLPLVGKRLKRNLVYKRAAAMPFVAWPNRKANEAVVPEVRGVLRPEDVALEAVQLLGDAKRRAAMSRRLRDVMGPGGAAGRVAERLLAAAEAAGGAKSGVSKAGADGAGDGP